MSDEHLPPGPWTWQHVIPQGPVECDVPEETEVAGEALVSADGTWLVWSEDGYGSPDVHPGVKELLAAAWRLAEPAEQPKEDAPRPLRSSYGKLAHLADETGQWDINAVRADLTRQAERSLDEQDEQDEQVPRPGTQGRCHTWPTWTNQPPVSTSPPATQTTSNLGT